MEEIADNVVDEVVEDEIDEAESQAAGEEDGLDLSDDQKEDEPKGDLTKRMSERVNAIRAKEVEPLRAQISELESRMKSAELERDALKSGKTVDELQSELDEQERSARELIDKDPEVQALRGQVMEAQKSELLRTLKDAFPDDTITSLEKLDKTIFQLMVGGVDPVTAYRFVRDSSEKPKKPSSGSSKSDGPVIKKDFYSREEVEAMTTEEVKKNYDAVVASTKKWK